MVKQEPLTSQQKKGVIDLVNAYAGFWTGNAKFTHNWAKPLFTFEEVHALLETAAQIVVRIRAQLDWCVFTPWTVFFVVFSCQGLVLLPVKIPVSR